MSGKKRVAIIGAGFSGLTLARALLQRGFEVDVFEAKPHVGGLIQTTEKPVMVEWAAHAILASRQVEELFEELNMKPERGGYKSKAKWIFRGKPCHWPFTLSESFQVVPKLISGLFNKSKRPEAFETLQSWTDRISAPLAQKFLFGPGFQGIYGANSDALSASLVLGGVFRKDLRNPRGKIKGSLAPHSGMHELLERLYQHLLSKGMKFHLGNSVAISDIQNRFDITIVATSMKSARQLLETSTPQIASLMKSIPSISITTVTMGFEKLGKRIRGFGCLFPRSEGFSSLGVLFNTDLFANRGVLESETWILGDEVSNFSDSRLLETLLEERTRLGAEKAEPKHFVINRLPEVLPMYGLELERFLSSDVFALEPSEDPLRALEVQKQGARVRESVRPLYLSGNYLGGIGLTKILSYNHRLAERIQRESQGGL